MISAARPASGCLRQFEQFATVFLTAGGVRSVDECCPLRGNLRGGRQHAIPVDRFGVIGELLDPQLQNRPEL